MTKKDEILALLADFPDGLTAREIKDRLGLQGNGSLMGLFREKKIDRKGAIKTYRYFLSREKPEPKPKPQPEKLNPASLFGLQDAPVFAAVKRRQEASCKV